jgi:diguanylate cyclase (GGDEF)-like protein
VRIASWAVLCLFVVAGLIGGLAWRHSLQDDARNQFDQEAAAAGAVVTSQLARDTDLMASLGGLATSNPDLTNQEFQVWYRAAQITERFPGGVGFAVIDEVDAAELPAFAAQQEADPVIGLATTGPFEVFPADEASQYCLQRAAIWTSSTFSGFSIPAGFNFCAPKVGATANPVLPVLAEATDSAGMAVMPSSQFNVGTFAVFTALYRDGGTPASVEDRRAQSTGWASGSFDATQLIAPALPLTEGRLEVVHTAPDGTVEVVVSSGEPTTPSTRSDTFDVATDGSWQVRVTGTPVVSGLSPDMRAWAIFAACALVGGLIFAFIRTLATSREWALLLAREKTAELEYQALHDTLTDLPNRALLIDRAEQMLARSRRDGTAVGALFVDLDNFKGINDTQGHAAGDQLLTSVAERIRTTLRSSDTVGRLGGDEFVVLVEGSSLAAGPEAVAERLMAVLTEPFRLDDLLVPVSASIGIAVGARENADELLRDADLAMYRAKATGRNRYAIFEPQMQAAAADRALLELDLRRALDQGEFFVLYQPSFDLRSGLTVGVEALIRWQHPTRGVLAPADFLAAAEQTGLIVPIGLWVLDEACRQGVEWDHRGHGVRVAVNISAGQLDEPRFVEDVRDVLATTGFPPTMLVLEIAESTLMRDAVDTRARLVAFKDLGVSIVIDDFGTGYSSLGYLQQFPVDAIKIDRSFISGIAASAESNAVIRTLVQLGKALHLETFAEGIEEQGQLDDLISEQCDAGQGFLYARPLPPDEIDAFLAAHTGRAPSS